MKKTHKLLILLALVCTLLVCGMMSASAEDTPPTVTTQSGTVYYQLSTAQDLYWFAEQVNSGLNGANYYNAMLMNDIDINPGETIRYGDNLNGGTKQWIPIGVDERRKDYRGIFDGQGYVIRGLCIVEPDMDNVGLFGYASYSAEIKNVGIENSYISGDDNVGGILGYGFGTEITNCYNSGYIKGNASIGGIVGFGESIYLKNCYNTFTVYSNLPFKGKLNADNEQIPISGGIAGCLSSSNFENCYNTGMLKSKVDKGTEYSLIGDTSKTKGSNSYYISDSNSGMKKSSEAFASGEVAYLLNQGVTSGEQAFYQNIDNCEEADAIPTFKGGTVYENYCADVCLGYSNTKIDNAIHIAPEGADCTIGYDCKVCGTEVSAVYFHTNPKTWDCTEGMKCVICNTVRIAAVQNHTGGTANCATQAVCTVCNQSYGDLDKNNHDIIPHEGKAATCVEKGYESYNTCSRCDYTSYKEIEIDKNAHTGNYVYEVGKKSPTCGVNGFTGDTVCECSTVMVSGTTIPATGDHVGGTATCIAQAICTVCSQSYGDIDSDNHSYNYVIIKEQTHYEDGLGEYKCECGDSYTEIIKMDQHNYYRNWVEVYPTHFYDGLRKFVCTCGYVKNESIPKITTHNYETSYVYADCTNEGYVLHSCECGDSYKTNQTVALGHEDNNHDGKCDNRCGYDFTKDCDHMCHKGGFWYKFCLFFWKLFKMNKTCSCGMYHY